MRWALLKSLRDADEDTARLAAAHAQLDALRLSEAAAASREVEHCKKRWGRQVEAQAARLEQLACELELSKCMLAAKEDQLTAFRMMGSPRGSVHGGVRGSV